MSRRRLDISYEYDDMSRVGFWAPEAPDFLDKREKRRAQQAQSRSSATRTAPAVEPAASAVSPAMPARKAPSFPVPKGRQQPRGYTPIIEFAQIERPRSAFSPGETLRHGQTAPRSGGQPYRGTAVREDAAVRGSDTAYRPYMEGRLRPLPNRGASTQRGSAAGVQATRPRQNRASVPECRSEPRYQDEWQWEEEIPQDDAPRGRFSQVRHELRHRKADRAFNRRYEDVPASSAEGAPRAALYKGKMGRQHHRAARMQAQGTGMQLGGLGGLPALPSLPLLDRLVARPHFARAAFAALCVVFLAVSIFPAAQGYYQQLRTNDQAQAEYQAILERNEDLQQQVDTLQTDEGMAALAHESLGWVKDGEHSVSVVADGSSGAGAGTGSQAQGGAVATGSVPAPTTWYSPVLDVVFGYEG